MGSLFGSPATPTIQAAPSVPKKTDAEIGAAAEKAKQRRKFQKGRAATILSKGTVGEDSTGLATKELLGA